MEACPIQSWEVEKWPMENTVAEKKKPTKKKDAHKSGFLMRFPESYREKLKELKAKTRRPYTVEGQMAMDAHLKANGIEPPDTST